MYFIGKYHEALVRTVPHGFVVVAKREPRENAVLIGQQQSVYAQVAAHRQTSVFIG
jgi:hypothetical protein